MATYNTSVTTADPCPCCGPQCFAAILECRFQGGTASLCGYPEYTTPSTPARKYRTETIGGQLETCNWNTGTTCAGSIRIKRLYEYSLSADYNSSNCTLVNGTNRDLSSSNLNPGTNCASATLNFNNSATPPTPFEPDEIGNYSPTNFTETQTTREWEWDGSCRTRVGGESDTFTGTPTATLSNEDTDTDAIARLLPTLTWSSWATPGSFGCGDSPPSCCLAEWQSRTTGYTFDYQESQWRISASGLAASTVYEYSVDIYRRTYGSGSYTLFSTIEGTGITDGGGNFEEEGDVPNAVGFQTYAASAQICEVA